VAPSAHASFLSGDALAKAANVIALVVIVIVPIVLIVLFWMVHVLPEKIAHKRHHPQTEAIQVLCLLSLVFGGLLWPLAWLWAYSKPVLYKMAYGTDRHPDYYASEGHGDAGAHGEAAVRGEGGAMPARSADRDLQRLRDALADLRSSDDPATIQSLRAELVSLEKQLADRQATIAVARSHKAEAA
jgi:hypothetical protein